MKIIPMHGEYKETSRLFKPFFVFSMAPMFFLFIVLLIVAVRQRDTADTICAGLAIVLLLVTTAKSTAGDILPRVIIFCM